MPKKAKRQQAADSGDPSYCDVSVLRWQAFTGKTATLESTGQTYAKTKAKREKVPRRRSAQVRTAARGNGLSAARVDGTTDA